MSVCFHIPEIKCKNCCDDYLLVMTKIQLVEIIKRQQTEIERLKQNNDDWFKIKWD